MKNPYFLPACALIAATLSACQATSSSPSAQTNITLGLVQKEIKVGTSSLHVLETLGSPNIVKTQQESENEVWIYDKIYQTNSNTKVGIGGLGGGSDLIALANAQSSSSESSSKSLTVIIKFNEQEQVDDVSYLRTAF